MIAYKFLDPRSIGPYSQFSWPLPTNGLPGAWVEVQGALQLCRNGIHACRAGQLPYWWGAQLWEVELTEPTADFDQVVLASQGRILRQVGAWDESMMRRYAQACAWRVRDHSVERLRALRLDTASTLAACTSLHSLAATATTLVDAVPDTVTTAVGYLADAASFSTSSMSWVKTVPYVAAHAAGCIAGPEAGPEYEKCFRAERKWQSQWLAEHLELATN